MTPQTPEQQQSDIAQLVAQKMGVPPEQAPQPPQQAAPPQQAPQPPQQQQETPPTDAEKTDAQASPQTEGDKMEEDPILYSFKRGDEEVKLTPQQLQGMYDRYEKLIGDYSEYGAFAEMGKKLMQKLPPGTKPEQAIDELIRRAMKHNPQMGQQADQSAPQMSSKEAPSNEDVASKLEQWEKENAVTLPPGYKEMMQSGGSMQGELAQMRQMLQQVLSQSAGVANAAKISTQGNINQAADVQKQRIQNNMREVFNAANVSEQDISDFNVFAAERGYTPIDFASKGLLAKVVQDYQANKNSPEMERMRDIHKRRQAFTGRAVGATPQSGANGGQPQGRLEQMIQEKLQRRFG